jgi:hypothetical protein
LSYLFDLSFPSEKVHLTIAKQKKIMHIQSQLIGAANDEVPSQDVAALRFQLSQLQSVASVE